MITITEGIAQPYKQQAKVTNFWLSTSYMWEFWSLVACINVLS